LHLRKFVLVPLAEIAPEFIHPSLKKSTSELLISVPDNSTITLWKSAAEISLYLSGNKKTTE